jgi:DNA polymerase III subunit epsilon
MDFVAVDVETANADLASICQIGIAAFADGALVDCWQSLVNPEDYFDEVNIGIHGIDKDAVTDAPTFPEIRPIVDRYFSRNLVVSHTAFDRIAVSRAFDKYQLCPPHCEWLDTARVVRRRGRSLRAAGTALQMSPSLWG